MWASRITLALVSLLIALAVVELLARFALPLALAPMGTPAQTPLKVCTQMLESDPDTGWWIRPNLDCKMPHEGGYFSVRTNSARFRADREYWEISQKKESLRIGIFGDSFTYGFGVERWERFGDLMEEHFADIEVLNFGLPGGGPDQSLIALRSKAAPFGLDVVIVAPSVENIVRIRTSSRDGISKPYYTVENDKLRLKGHPVDFVQRAAAQGSDDGRTGPALYRLLSRQLESLASWQMLQPVARTASLELGWYRPYVEYYNDAETRRLLYEILIAFKREANGASLLYVPLPTYHYIEYDLAKDYESVFQQAAEAVGGTYIDLLPAFRQFGPSERRAMRFTRDQHYTPLAHKVVAKSLVLHIEGIRQERLAQR